MRVFILGCGYLGRRIAEVCLQRGWEVGAATRNVETVDALRRLGVDAEVALAHDDSWHDIVDTEIDFLVNCVGSAGGGLDGYRLSYIEGNRSLGRWMRKAAWYGRALYTSSIGVYGDAGGEWVDVGNEGEAESERGRLIGEAEAVFAEEVEQAGAEGTILRVGGLYGPGRHLLLDALRSGPSVMGGFGDYYLNLIRVEDAALAALSAVEVSRGAGCKVFNAVDDCPALKEEIVAWLASRLGVARPEFDPSQSGRASWRGGRERPANRRVSNRSLREATGWKPRFRDYREGFAELMG